MQVVRTYLESVAAQDWVVASSCLAETVRRVGPFGDTYEGRAPYLAFLEGLMPTLAGYRMEIDRITALGDAPVALAELSETMDLGDGPTRTAECLVFDLDPAGLISQIAIYIRPPTPVPPS